MFDIPDWCLVFGDFAAPRMMASESVLVVAWLPQDLDSHPAERPDDSTGCRALTSANNLSPKPEAGKSAKIRRVEGKIIPGNYFGYVRF